MQDDVVRQLIERVKDLERQVRDLQRLDTSTYLPGSWTPSIRGDTLGTLAVTYTAQDGEYRIVNGVCRFSLWIRIDTFSLGTGSGPLRVSLPVTAIAGTGSNRAGGVVQLGGVSGGPNFGGTVSGLSFGPVANSTIGRIYLTTNNAATSLVEISAFAAGDDIWVTGEYLV